MKTTVKEERVERDLEYLMQEIDRKPSLDEELKRDLQSKRQNSRYLEMLVRDAKTDGVLFSASLSISLVSANE